MNNLVYMNIINKHESQQQLACAPARIKLVFLFFAIKVHFPLFKKKWEIEFIFLVNKYYMQLSVRNQKEKTIWNYCFFKKGNINSKVLEGT